MNTNHTNNMDIRWLQRLQNFEQAFMEFSSACSLARYSKLERSGLIQTFEFTFELAWKTLQDLLISRGYHGVMGPKPVIEQSFQDGIIENGEVWINMLMSRNLASHTYREKTAEELAILIKTDYFPSVSKLIDTLRQERARVNALRNS